MDNIPNRTKIASYYRNVLNKYEGSLKLPINNPSFYQVFALLFSLSLMFTRYKPLILVVVLITLLLDWFDGAVARKQGLASHEGWMIDVVVDRISEGFMFIAILDLVVGKVFFLSYLINILLSFYSVKTGKHILLAVRFAYLIYLLVTLPHNLWL